MTGAFIPQKTNKRKTNKHPLKKNVSPIPLTWIAILPINFYDGNIVMRNIHKILTLSRFIVHGTLIVLSFVLFDDNDNIVDFKIYICVSFVIVFGLYFYIVVYDEDAIPDDPTTTNRTFRQLLDLNMSNEIVEMYVFGFKYSDDDWRKVMQDKDVSNDKIGAALTAFLTRDVKEVDSIFSSIECNKCAK